MSRESSSIKTVKSHTDKKYRKSYLHTRVHSNRKNTLLMKGHPHEFGAHCFLVLCSYSFIKHANKINIGLCCGTRRLCFAMKEQLPGW